MIIQNKVNLPSRPLADPTPVARPTAEDFSARWMDRLTPSSDDPNLLLDPNSFHCSDGKPIAYLKDRLEFPTLRRRVFDNSPFLFSVGTGTLSAWAGHLAGAVGGPAGYLLAAAAGAAVQAAAFEGIAETRQDRKDGLKSGLLMGAIAGLAGAATGPVGTTLAGATVGALSTPL